MGVKLFNRSPRAVTLTSDGEDLYSRCGDLLYRVEDARAVIGGDQGLSPGKLRIALPISFAQQLVAPHLPSWQRHNPQISLEVVLTDRHVDLVQERFDLAVRFDQLVDSRLVARKLAVQTFITAASPGYLSPLPLPQTVDEVMALNCLGYIDQQSNQPRPWRFSEKLGSGSQSNGVLDHRVVSPQGSVVSDQGTFLLNCALAGGGVIHAPEYLLRHSLDSGSLLELLPDYHSEGPSCWLVYPFNRHPSQRLQRFLSFLEAL